VPIRVVVAEDNVLLREGLGRVVSAADDMELVGAAADVDGLRAVIDEAGPDVVVTDIRMPPTSTDEGVRVLSRHAQAASPVAGPAYDAAMASFASSVSIEESLDKVVAYTQDDGHLHLFVSAVEGHATVGEVTEWHRVSDRQRHRVEWTADAYDGWLEVNREGYVASVSVGVHTSDDAGAQDRLDQALGELKDAVEAVDAADLRKAEASSSFVVETVLKSLVRAIPAEQRAAMTPYLEHAGELDGRPALEERRVKVCVHWAREAAERGGGLLGRLGAEIAEVVEHLEGDADAALVDGERRSADLLAKAERFDPQEIGEGEVPSGFHEQLNHVYDALRRAHKLAARHGWDAVPWPALLEGLFAVKE
jgi:hypothetical protein